MGTMRSRRGGVPGRRSPTEEIAGGGGEVAVAVTVAVAVAVEIAASWIFFHGSSGERKKPRRGRKGWAGWAGLKFPSGVNEGSICLGWKKLAGLETIFGPESRPFPFHRRRFRLSTAMMRNFERRRWPIL
jgi:hypothetical protein